MTMQELIERLEKATSPNFAVEREVADAFGWPSSASAPVSMSLIDDALKFLRPGYGAVSLSINEHGQSSARLGHPYVYGNAFNAATAIVICLLRARLALASDGEKQ